MADVLVAHRRPTIRILRSAEVEHGVQVVLYWNGSRAANGDGLPGGAAPVDDSKPLAAPASLWAKGAVGFSTGGFSAGAFGANAAPDPTLGFSRGPYSAGPFGVGLSYWTWRFPFELRNGVYVIEARLMDALGNGQEMAIDSMSIEVAAVPRPVSKAWLAGYKVPILTIAWRHSPDLV